MTRNELEPLLHNRKGIKAYLLNRIGEQWSVVIVFRNKRLLIMVTDLQEATDKITKSIKEWS